MFKQYIKHKKTLRQVQVRWLSFELPWLTHMYTDVVLAGCTVYTRLAQRKNY